MNTNDNHRTSTTSSYLVVAQKDTGNFSNFTNLHYNKSSNTLQNETAIVKAYGHFANNQIKNNIVTWIEGGIWNLEIAKGFNNSNMHTSLTSDFTANFTMIKPDGSLSHSHVINNFESENVIFSGKDIIVLGIADIHSDNGTEYSKVPITIHLMGKKVLGLMIDVSKTESHFAGASEMFGTLISGVGLDNSTAVSNHNANYDVMLGESNNTYSTNPSSMAHMKH